MTKEMAFRSDYERTRYNRYIHEVAVLHLPHDSTEQIEFARDGITIDGRAVALSTHATQALGRTLAGANRMTFDCTTFAVSLSGGVVAKDLFTYMRREKSWTARMTYRDIAHLNNAAELPRVLEPTALGTVVRNEDGNSAFKSRHTVVRLDSDSDMYASKLGPGPVCIADLQTTAELYSCDAVATMLTADVWTGWRRQRHQMHYDAPDASTAQPLPDVTQFSASDPSWLARRVGVTVT